MLTAGLALTPALWEQFLLQNNPVCPGRSDGLSQSLERYCGFIEHTHKKKSGDPELPDPRFFNYSWLLLSLCKFCIEVEQP